MESTLQPGLTFEFHYKVPTNRTVPHLYPEAPQLLEMPQVFATGYLVGLIEWACIEAINPHIDWPRQQSVGIHIDISHTAATPPGFTVTVKGVLTHVEGRELTFEVEARDELDRIATGSHRRFVIDAQRFNQRVTEKADKISS